MLALGNGEATGVLQEAAMYVDPASGSLILQLLAAGALAAVATMTRVRNALRGFFRSLLRRRTT